MDQSKEVSIFKFRYEETSLDIRMVVVDGEPMFVASDICKGCGLANVSMAVRSLEEDEKGIIQIDTLGGSQSTLAVKEPGLYRLMAKSEKSEAKPFQRWVFHEVLPSIRKTGSYTAPNVVSPARTASSGFVDLDQLILKTEQGIKRNQQALGYLKKARTLFSEDDFVKQAPASQKLLKPVYSQKELEDKILIYVEKNQNQTDLDKVPTIRNLSRYTRATVDVLRPIVEDLIRMNVLCKVQAGKAIYYIPAA